MSSTDRPIVLGLDGTHDAPLRFAVHEAQWRGAPLRIVHCVAMAFDQMGEYVSDLAFREMMAAGQEVLDQSRRTLDMDGVTVDVEYVLSDRAPVDLLTEESETAQLLVTGIDDIPWYDRLLGGAVAGRLAEHASCPLITVPEPNPEQGRQSGVVAALDGNSAARPLLRLAFDEAQERGCAVHALRVVPDSTEPSVVEEARASLSEVLAGWSEQYPDVQVKQEVVVGSPDDACRAATRDAELVLVGRSRPHGHRRPIAANVVRHAACAVGVVPLDEPRA